MSTLALFRLPPDQFPLAESLAALPEVAVEAERVVATGSSEPMALLWVVADDPGRFERFDAALRVDPSVDSAAPLGEMDDERLYAVAWTAGTLDALSVLVGDGGVVLSARGDADGWRIRALFAEHDALSATFHACREAGVDVEVEAVQALEHGAEHGRYGLTPDQYESLVAAVERGYFDVPRGVSTEELAAETGVTHQALSERLRRGQKALVRHALGVDVDDDEGGSGERDVADSEG